MAHWQRVLALFTLLIVSALALSSCASTALETITAAEDNPAGHFTKVTTTHPATSPTQPLATTSTYTIPWTAVKGGYNQDLAAQARSDVNKQVCLTLSSDGTEITKIAAAQDCPAK